MKSSTHYIGKAGELAVASQLLMREVSVHFPVVDDGVDLVAGGKVRIQVKTSRKHTYRNGGYVFTLGKRTAKYGHKQYWLTIPDWTEVDYLICCGLDDSKFWVIPTAVVRSFPCVQSLLLGTGHFKLVDHAEIENLLRSGLSQSEVAKAMGISPMCVSGHKAGKRPKGLYENSLSAQSDKYEGAWDQLVQVAKTAVV